MSILKNLLNKEGRKVLKYINELKENYKDKKYFIPEFYDELIKLKQVKMYDVILPYFLADRRYNKKELYTINKVFKKRGITFESISEVSDRTEKLQNLFKRN